MRAPWYLCRYVGTDEIKQPGGMGYTHGPLHFPSIKTAPVYVYRLKRVYGPILLTAEEGAALVAALEEGETGPILLPEDQATEGKAL